MDYPCAKFGDFSFSRLVSSCRQTDRQTDRITDAAERFTPETVVGVSEYRQERNVWMRKIIDFPSLTSRAPTTVGHCQHPPGIDQDFDELTSCTASRRQAF